MDFSKRWSFRLPNADAALPTGSFACFEQAVACLSPISSMHRDSIDAEGRRLFSDRPLGVTSEFRPSVSPPPNVGNCTCIKCAADQVQRLAVQYNEDRLLNQDAPRAKHVLRQADTVLFIASPHSLVSKVVEWELAQVRLNGKRLAPVVIGDIEGIDLPQEIAKINYVAFDDSTVFDQRADELAHALNTDVAWLKEHTRFGELARRWRERGRPEEALVRGQDLKDAENWASRRPREAHIVTAEQVEYLEASRAAETGRRRAEETQALRRRHLRLAFGFIAACGLAYIAWFNRSYVAAQLALLMDVIRPQILTTAQERGLKAQDAFRECSLCPEMVVIPAGRFMMGSPSGEPGRRNEEDPYHEVVI